MPTATVALAVRQRSLRGVALGVRHTARHEAHLDPERREIARQRLVMLAGDEIGGRHDGGLPAAAGCHHRREQGDHGLAGADIALDEADHPVRRGKVCRDLGDGKPLRRR